MNHIFAPSSKIQRDFLVDNESDISFYGGGSASGKTTMLLYKLLPLINSGKGRALVIAKYPKVSGGIFDKAVELFNVFGAEVNTLRSEIVFPCGFVVKFVNTPTGHYLRNYDTVLVDQLEEYGADTFFALQFANKLHATYNVPDESEKPHWLREYLSPVISDNGWVNKKVAQAGWYCENSKRLVKLFQATVTDNPHMVKQHPDYCSRLSDLGAYQTARLRYGYWIPVDENYSNFIEGFFENVR